MRIAVTGGIACGKSLFAQMLRELGAETLDADDIVHELLPEDERKRLAKIAFRDPGVRKALEKRLHPLVEERYEKWFAAPCASGAAAPLRVAVIPLLFEAHWEKKYDIICAVVCDEERQIERMTGRRGLTRQEAHERLVAQLPNAEKAARAHYAIHNDGTAEDLRKQAAAFVAWIRAGARRPPDGAPENINSQTEKPR